MVADALFAAPTTVEEAVTALGAPDAVALAGGTSVGILIGQGLLTPSSVVWLGRIDTLRQVHLASAQLRIGAGVTLAELAAHPLARQHVPALARAADVVGNSRVRSLATIGGALAHGDPRQDLPPVCLAYGATVEVAGRLGRRQLLVEDLVTGFMTTVLEPDELITAVTFPVVEGARSAYLRYTPASCGDFPTVGIAATAGVTDGVIDHVALAVGGAGPRAYRVPEADQLIGRPWASSVDEVADAAARRADPVDDRLGSAAYKRAMVSVWVRRALTQVLTHVRTDERTDDPDQWSSTSRR